MKRIKDTALESNRKLKINFNGGDLSSDAGMHLIKEFVSKMGFDRCIKQVFHTKTNARVRVHTDDANLLQMIYQIQSANFQDDCADELTNDPVFTTILNKDALASQPTLSRFHNRMDVDTLEQFNEITREFRRRVYSIKPPEMILFDLDSTMLETHGNQEGQAYNGHYHTRGYHPLMCYDGLTGDLLKGELRKGTDYSCKGVCEFMQPLFDEFQENYPDTALYLRGDSGFATPDLYKQCETNGTSYVIRLKENAVLQALMAELSAELAEKTQENMVDYAVVYGEFYYQAGSWDYERRVVCKIEKPVNQMIHMSTCIVTNMDLDPESAIRLYYNRGRMENFIKEGKNGFDFAAVSSHSKIVNDNRFQIHVMAYNIFNWFRRLVLPKAFQKLTVDTIRLKLLKIAARLIRSAGYMIFKLCSSYPYKDAFYKTLENIGRLTPQLA